MKLKSSYIFNLIFILCLLDTLSAQKYQSSSFFDLSELELNETQRQKQEMILKRIYSVEFEIKENLEQQYTYIHTATWINSDEAIKDNNKIYIESTNNSEYLYQRSRVISSSGKITELDEEDIKEGYYGEGDQQSKYYYYAVEGLEKGSIIESISYKKSYPNYYGVMVYLQGSIAYNNQMFELICPSHLLFEFKSINGAPEAKKDTTSKVNNRWTVTIDSTEKILDQPNVFNNVVKQSVIYKLSRNIAQNRGDITSYSRAVNNIHNKLRPEISKKTKKKIEKIYKELEIGKLNTTKEKITAIENYAKSNFQIFELNNDQLENLDLILDNKIANEDGIIMLQLKLLDMADISYEIIVTCDRSQFRFDKDFEAYLYLNDFLLYFPETKEYMAPSEKYLRGKYIPDLLSHNYGLFIKQVQLGELTTAIGEVKFIDALPYDQSKDIMDIHVDFSDHIASPEVKIKKTSTGYSAQYFQPYFHLMDEEALAEIKETLAKGINEQMKVEDLQLYNIDVNDFGSKPFIFELSSNEHSFVEKVGKDILFKIGELIGPQVEMYQENDRQFDVESNHNRYYERTITFNVPAGYSLKNAEEMNFAHKFGEEGKQTLFFESSIQKEGNEYKVFCKEYYSEIIIPKEQFEEYKTVINAAADFNKKVLVFEQN